MIYPGIVITMGVAVVITMSFTLVPAVSKLYGDLGKFAGCGHHDDEHL